MKNIDEKGVNNTLWKDLLKCGFDGSYSKSILHHCQDVLLSWYFIDDWFDFILQ